MLAQVALLALLIEALAGYPDRLYRAVGHPVTWIGWLITRCEQAWNRPQYGDRGRRALGIGLVVVLVTVSLAVGVAIDRLAFAWLGAPLGLAVCAIAASTLIAQRSLDQHVAAVARALDTGGLAGGRMAVSAIVGRDPDALDEAGVARAAIESLAENASDGVTAPLFWLLVGGLPGIITYKSVNTADSMVGHRSERHRDFGWAAARLDDVLNLPASRLTALLIVLAALISPATSARGALRAVWRDAGRHRSPNAGWPEAAMAGALGLRLAGPRVYGGRRVDDHWMGSGRADATAADIRAALGLYRRACAIQIALVGLIAVATWPL